MKRSVVNFWVDTVIGLAFLVAAVSGIVFLLPISWRDVTAAGIPSILGVSTATWHTLHEWSAVIMTAGVGVHTLLHLGWIARMARRGALGGDASRPTRTRKTPALQPPPQAAAAAAPGRTPSPYDAADPMPVRARSPQTGADPLPARASALEPAWERRSTRKGFLIGAATAAAATLLLGFSALRNNETSSALTQVAQQNWGDEDSEEVSGWSGDGSGAENGSSQPGGAPQATAPGSGGSGSAGLARVSVDAGSCVGCGRCLQACPYGVFAWSGQYAVAQNPDACQLCGRCLQVCPAGAITLNG